MRLLLRSTTEMILKNVAILGVFELLLTMFSTNAQVSVGTAYTEGYEITVYKGQFNFNEAKQKCINYGSKLLKVDSSKITNAIMPHLKSSERHWIGATDIAEEGRFKWLDGTDISSGYSNWNDYEPANGGGNEDCVLVKTNGRWNDLHCTAKIENFICQKKVIELFYNSHFFKFHRQESEKITFHEAVRSCERSGSRLVEIRNKDSDDVMKKNIESGWMFYWIGGSDIQVEGEWIWNNRTVVEELRWKQGEPNGERRENCLTIIKQGWVDLNCSRKVRYICEKVGASDIKVSASSLRVSDGEEGTIICTANGYPFPSYSWERNGIVVSHQRWSSGVYQTATDNEAILHVTGATLQDEGVYICWANNTVENIHYADRISTNISVPSHPTDVSAFGNSCNTSITIAWKPNKRAVEALHKIEVQSNNTNKISYNILPTKHENTLLIYATQNLSAFTYYDVTISPCLTSTECKSAYAVSTTVLTGGIPGEVISIKNSARLPTSCEVRWSKPNLIVGQFSHQITINESIMEVANGYSDEISTSKFMSGNDTSYIVNGRPNRRYLFGIQTINCQGMGPSVWSKESCNTAKQAPDVVPPPLIVAGVNKVGEATITIEQPDQENGPISCLFLIVKDDLANSTNRLRSFTQENLKEVNASMSSEFIAVALASSRLRSRTKVVLGNGNITSCDINLFGYRERRSIGDSSTFVGLNIKLDPTLKYSIYIVSVTPTPDGPLLKASDMQPLVAKQTNTGNRNDSTEVLIPAAVGGILGLLLLLVGLIVWRKRLCVRPHNKKKESKRESNIGPPTQLDTEYETYCIDSTAPIPTVSGNIDDTELNGVNDVKTEAGVYEEIKEENNAAYETPHLYMNSPANADVGGTESIRRVEGPYENTSSQYETVK